MTEADLAAMYRRVLREPLEGTMTAAIDAHAQACGLVAYVAGVHPDDVARAVTSGASESDPPYTVGHFPHLMKGKGLNDG